MLRLLALMLLTLAVSGCPRVDEPPALASPAVRAEPLPLRLGGDGTATPLINHLVQVFESRLPGVPLVVEAPLGAAGARAAMADGLLAGVLETTVPGETAEGVVLARSAVVLVVGPGVRSRRITEADLIELAGGHPTPWPGGLPRQLVLRPSDDPVQRALEGALPALRAPLQQAAKNRQWPVHQREATLREALRRPGVLGAADRGNLRLHGSPTFEVDLPGRRPATVELRLVAAEPMPPRLRAFVAFATGDEGRSLIGDLGFEPPSGGVR